MSAERMVNAALLKVVGVKLLGDTVRCAAGACDTACYAFATARNCIQAYGSTLLMIESHYANRYTDLTGRSLDYAGGLHGRHAMVVPEPGEEVQEG